MALTVVRDLEELRTGLERWLGRPIVDLARPAPGFSCETLIVDGDLVVRLPPVGDGIFPAYDLAQQSAVQAAAGAAGVPVALPCRYIGDESFVGTGFVAMPFAAGPIPSDFTPTDAWLTGLASDADRGAVWASFVDVLLAIHATPVDGLGLRTGLGEELAAWERYVAWCTDGSPPAALVDVLAWCRAELPAEEPAAGLLWGDVRLGNVVFDAASLGPRAVLDWDMATAGPFELDLAWFLALEQVQVDLTGMTVPGFGDRAATIARAEAGLGRELRDLSWCEVFSLARASAISTRIAVLHQRAGQRSMFKIGDDPSLTAALARIG